MTSNELTELQNELKAPKNQRNNFGKYSYRSAEDILEAVKPLLKKYNAQLVIYDKPIMVGEWHYIEATATLTIGDKQIINTASAREATVKKGMDESQITGTASSYARKYALNGLFLIDDTKDADTNEYRATTHQSASRLQQSAKTSADTLQTFTNVYKQLTSIAGKDKTKEIYQKIIADKKIKLSGKPTDKQLKVIIPELKVEFLEAQDKQRKEGK